MAVLGEVIQESLAQLAAGCAHRGTCTLIGIVVACQCALDLRGIEAALAPFRRPLFTLGREPLAHLDDIPPHQFWLVRCLDPHPGNARAQVVAARGPFTLDGERALFALAGIDVVVSKNSGGAATEAKLEVARERRLPVVMLRRPPLPDADRAFDSAAALLDALDPAARA